MNCEIKKNQKIIVSVTPVALSSDSRALKIAKSFSNQGYKSIVLEGNKSTSDYSNMNIVVQTLNANKRQKDNAEEKPSPLKQSKVKDIYFIKLRKTIKKILPDNIYMLWTYSIFIRFLFKNFISVYKDLLDADLYYIHSYDYSLAILIKSYFKNKPVVYDAHDLYLDLLESNDSSLFCKKYMLPTYQFMEKWLIHKSTIVVTTSRLMSIEIRNKYLMNKKPLVIRNCHDCRLDDIAAINVKSFMNIKESNFLVAVVGNLKPAHELGSLLKAISLCKKKIYLVLIGKGYEVYSDLITELRLSDQVYLPGKLDPTKIVPYIRGADLAVLPYKPTTLAYDVFLPNGFFQSISAGLPILYGEKMKEVDDLNEKHHFGKSYNTHDISSLCDHLNKFAEEISSLADYRNNCVELAQSIAWENEEQLLLANINAIVSS